MNRGFFSAALTGSVLIALAASVLFSAPRAQTKSPADSKPVNPAAAAVGPTALWNPPPQALAAVRAKCFGDPTNLAACFAAGMEHAGASSAAVAFTKSIPNDIAYLRAFRSAGPVGIAYVEFPFRANENEGVFLVNGRPPLVNVDDQKALPMEALRADPAYAALAKQFPQISFWPGDRFHIQTPFVTPARAGVRIIVSYILRESCHACATVGSARFAFDFDAAGKLQNVRLFAVNRAVAPSQATASTMHEIHAFVGKQFTITLDANRTTGYRWGLVADPDPAILAGPTTSYSESSDRIVGAPGREIWTFNPVGKGIVTLVFHYARPFEKSEGPAKTARYKIVVQ